MRLNSVFLQNSETGYGRMGNEFARALERAGVTMESCSPNYQILIPGTQSNTENIPVYANALWMGAPSHVTGWWEGQRTHVFTMWEATGVPPGFRENIHEIDTLIVPSEQNREMFSRWHDNVKKVPLGVNADTWAYRERQPVLDEFRFMTAGQGSRKGIDIACRAFSTVFGQFHPKANRARPVLIVKDRTGMKDVKGEGIREVTGTIAPEDEVMLYAHAHCFLGVARGEGWGMMPFQAMAQGCPSIIANAHGYAEFAHLAGIEVQCGMSKAEPFIFGDADQWWEPDFDEVCAAMWEMYVNYDDYLGKAAVTSGLIASTYTWDHAATKLIDAMGGKEALELPDIEARVWHKPSIQQFLIVPDKDCFYEINGEVHTFKKGEEYWDIGDLKRMMFENGNLDPICLQDIHETGLTPNQLSELDRYRSMKTRCQTCGQKLNSDTSLDFEDELV